LLLSAVDDFADGGVVQAGNRCNLYQTITMDKMRRTAQPIALLL